VDHSRAEYGYTDRKTGLKININTVEGYYSIFKRGMIGIYQHCGEQHLHRYLAEFDFRYSNRIKLGVDDIARADRALVGVKGKRLTYETTRACLQLTRERIGIGHRTFCVSDTEGFPNQQMCDS
jgi:hypothetical protein